MNEKEKRGREEDKKEMKRQFVYNKHPQPKLTLRRVESERPTDISIPPEQTHPLFLVLPSMQALNSN